jgi:hypothetical protein
MILQYNEFLTEKEVSISRRKFYTKAFPQFLNEDELVEATNLINEGLFDNLSLEKIEMLNESELYESLVLELNLIQKLKDKAADAYQVVKDKGKKALSAIQQGVLAVGGKIANIIKKIVENIKAVAKKAFEAGKKLANSAKSKMIEAFKNELDAGKTNDKDAMKNKLKSLKDDVQNGKKVGKHVIKWCTKDVAKETADAIIKGSKEDTDKSKKDKDTNESMGYRSMDLFMEHSLYNTFSAAIDAGEMDLNEIEQQLNEAGDKKAAKIPFISTIAKFVNKFPPFSILKTIKEKGAEATGGLLGSLSKMATKVMGAPGPYKFLAVATFIGLAFEILMKNSVKNLTKSVLTTLFFPPAAPFITAVFNAAYVLAAIAALEVVLGTIEDNDADTAKAAAKAASNKA